MPFAARQNYLRPRRAHEHARVTFVELFFDLVFVFAVTQLSHTLLEHFTLAGLAEAALLLLAVWWVWIYTTWFTNWTDPEAVPVRLILFALMLAGLILSTSIPEAFGARGLHFALAYVAMQVGRSLFMLWVTRHHHAVNFRNFQRIGLWFGLSALLWLAGGFAEGPLRFAFWAAALVVEYAGPSAGFWTPRLGRSLTTEWDVEGGHMAERCGLFVIIALGESILVTGATFAKLEPTPAVIAAFINAFVCSVAMWWLYFNIGAERASHHVAHLADPGRMARLAYTYLHIVLVAGIIVVAVGDELVLAHPGGHVEAGAALAMVGGPALYLLGNMLFKRTTAANLPLSHLAGLGLLALLAASVPVATPLALNIGSTVVIVVVCVWEARSLRSWRDRKETGAQS